MGQRATALAKLLTMGGLPVTPMPQRPGWKDVVAAGLAKSVRDVYRALNGNNQEPRVMPGAWDLSIDGVAIELDEERHFNRYRAITLESDVYERLQAPRLEYLRFCAEHEADCLSAASWRGNWTTPSAEKEFGPGGPERDLNGPGSPRWKQRAFYDFIKDLAPICIDVAVARLAIWDQIEIRGENRIFGQILASRVQDREWAMAVRNLVLERAARVPH
jgi:hypothetical protein